MLLMFGAFGFLVVLILVGVVVWVVVRNDDSSSSPHSPSTDSSPGPSPGSPPGPSADCKYTPWSDWESSCDVPSTGNHPCKTRVSLVKRTRSVESGTCDTRHCNLNQYKTCTVPHNQTQCVANHQICMDHHQCDNWPLPSCSSIG